MTQTLKAPKIYRNFYPCGINKFKSNKKKPPFALAIVEPTESMQGSEQDSHSFRADVILRIFTVFHVNTYNTTDLLDITVEKTPLKITRNFRKWLQSRSTL